MTQETDIFNLFIKLHAAGTGILAVGVTGFIIVLTEETGTMQLQKKGGVA
ncbi:hypothetical protein LAD64_24265 [Klebsiella pneumoniae]|nr:hypothetical protein [Klebsiella pneumoniae]